MRIFRGEKKYVAEAIGLHLEGEDLSELGLADYPAMVATMEFDSVA